MRRILVTLTRIAVVTAAIAAPATPALAKEGLQATLDAPIGMATPAGTIVRIGVSVTDIGEDGPVPVIGSPIYLRLTGADGSTTREAAAADGDTGHYWVDIAIPGGGARDIQVGIHGTSDLPMTIFGETFVSGGITPRTAQLAPAVAAAQPRPATGGGVAPVAEPVPAAQPAPAGQAAPAPVASGGTPASLPAPLAGAIALVAIGVTVSLLVGRRRRAQAA